MNHWENRDGLGWARAWWKTALAVTKGPAQFYEELEPDGPLGPPLKFAAIGSLLHVSGQALFAGLLMVFMLALYTWTKPSQKFGASGIGLSMKPPMVESSPAFHIL